MVTRAQGAITVALSAFVGTMSLLVGALALAVAPRQSHPVAGAEAFGMTNAGALLVSYVIALLCMMNAFVAFRYARFRPFIATGTVLTLVITTLMLNVLFARAW